MLPPVTTKYSVEANRLSAELWGRYPFHHGGIDTVKCGYCQRSGALLTPESRRTESRRGSNGMCGSSAARFGRSFKSTANTGQNRCVIQSSSSPFLTHILSKNHGSRCGGGKNTWSAAPPPSALHSDHRAHEGGEGGALLTCLSSRPNHTIVSEPFSC